MDAGSVGAPASTCSGNKRLGARTVRREQRPFTLTWCICHRGHCGSPIGRHTRNNTPVCAQRCDGSPVCPFTSIQTHTHTLKPIYMQAYKDTNTHTQERGDGITAGKWEQQLMKQALVQLHTDLTMHCGR